MARMSLGDKLIKSLVLLATFMVALSACAARLTEGRLFAETSPPSVGKSLVYVYYVDDTVHPFAFGVRTIMINNKPLAKLPRLGYSYAYLRPGVFRLDITELGITELSTEFLVEEGQTLFIRLSTTRGFTIGEVPREKALPEIETNRYVEPLNTEF